MTVEEARKFVEGLADRDRMVPLHRDQFDKALRVLQREMFSGVLERLDEIKNAARTYEDEAEGITDFMSELMQENGIVWESGTYTADPEMWGEK